MKPMKPVRLNSLFCSLLLSIFCLFVSSQAHGTLVSLSDFDYSVNSNVVSWQRTNTEFKNLSAFAFLLNNGQLFSVGASCMWPWESPFTLETPSLTENQTVQTIYSSGWAFAALLTDGSLVCWGHPALGGAAPYIAPERQVKSIVSCRRGFLALLDNGTLVSWGGMSALPDDGSRDKHVVSLFGGQTDFAVVLEDTNHQQTIVSCDTSSNKTQLVPSGRKVSFIVSTMSSFTALLDDGSIQSWGNLTTGGNTPSLPKNSKVTTLAAGLSAFSALLDNGMVLCWGDLNQGGASPTLPPGTKATSLFSNENDFAVVLSNGNIFSWGAHGTQSVTVPTYRSWFSTYSYNIDSIIGNGSAFTALCSNPESPTDNKTIVCWGDRAAGGTTPSEKTTGVSAVIPSSLSFTALYHDGTIQSWGEWASSFNGIVPVPSGPISTPTLPKGHTVSSLVSNLNTYVAILDDGSLFLWGGTKDFLDANNEPLGYGYHPEGYAIPLPDGTAALWAASPFYKYTLKSPAKKNATSSDYTRAQ